MLEYSVFGIDDAIAISTPFWLVEFCEGKEAIRMRRPNLRCEVTEQLSAIINSPIPVAIEHKEGIIRPSSSPSDMIYSPISIKIKIHAVCRAGQTESISEDID